MASNGSAETAGRTELLAIADATTAVCEGAEGSICNCSSFTTQTGGWPAPFINSGWGDRGVKEESAGTVAVETCILRRGSGLV